jgi:hypothetical protein
VDLALDAADLLQLTPQLILGRRSLSWAARRSGEQFAAGKASRVLSDERFLACRIDGG